jgi:hypothetical protein
MKLFVSVSPSFVLLHADFGQVGLIFIADTVNTFFDAAFLYKRLVYNFGESIRRRREICSSNLPGNIDAIMVADWVFNTGQFVISHSMPRS